MNGKTYTRAEIRQMDDKALEWWRIWKPVLRKVIETSPAKAGLTPLRA